MDKEDSIRIRDFRRPDLNDLLDLLPRCFAKEFEITGFDPDHMKDMVNRVFGTMGRTFMGLARLFGKEPVRFLVADAKNRIVGTTIVNRDGKVGYIAAVMVHPEYRNRGIATTLVKNAVEHVKKRRMDRAILDVVSTNSPAISVYSKLGFVEFERVVHMVGEASSLSAQVGTGVQTRLFQKKDIDEVYNLIRASDEPEHFRVYNFSKRHLKTPFWVGMFHFATQKRIVAVRDGKIVGYVPVTYTTPKEAGGIGFMRVNREGGLSGIDIALLNAAFDEIRKGGVRRIHVAVPAARQELIETAKSLGFREAMTIIGMYQETSDRQAPA
jgi:ribosomal protein S18 acetylase RimI-like enzyme